MLNGYIFQQGSLISSVNALYKVSGLVSELYR